MPFHFLRRCVTFSSIALLAACGNAGESAAPVAGSHPIDSMPAVPQATVPPAMPTPIPGGSSARFLSIAPTVANGGYGAAQGWAYDFGRLMVTSDAVLPDQRLVYPVRMQGWVRYPLTASNNGSERFPVLVLLHGMHDPSQDSFRGYEYLSEALVTNGYVVISIDANDVNAEQSAFSDGKSTARAQLVLATLDHFFDGETMRKHGFPLDHQLDRDRIGIMGHSRGGEGIAAVIAMNGRRTGVGLDEVRDAARLLSTAGISKSLVAQKQAGQLRNFSNPDVMLRHLLAVTTWADEADIQHAIDTGLSWDTVAKSSDLQLAAADSKTTDDALKNALSKAHIAFAPSQVGGPAQAPVYTFRGAFALAPMDLANVNMHADVPFATLLPSCDGDVFNYMGARMYDTNRFGMPGRSAARYQIFLRGANHNWFNTTWTYATPDIPTQDVATQDDANQASANEMFCRIQSLAVGAPAKTPAGSIRLSSSEQRRFGMFLMASFMRYFVGGESQFGAYWSTSSQIPSEICPQTQSSCDARALLTAQMPEQAYAALTDFRAFHAFSSAGVVENPKGVATHYAGFDAAVQCASFFSPKDFPASDGNLCLPVKLPSAKNSAFFKVGDGSSATYDAKSLFSTADHIELSWSAPGAEIVAPLDKIRIGDSDTLSFRIANADFAAQAVDVTLSDGLHPDVTIKAETYSDALYTQSPLAPVPPPKTHRMVLNMVAVPLDAFEGVDRRHLKSLKIRFPMPDGTVAVTDLQFQRLGRALAQPLTGRSG